MDDEIDIGTTKAWDEEHWRECDICRRPLTQADRTAFEANGAPAGEWPARHQDCRSAV